MRPGEKIWSDIRSNPNLDGYRELARLEFAEDEFQRKAKANKAYQEKLAKKQAEQSLAKQEFERLTNPYKPKAKEKQDNILTKALGGINEWRNKTNEKATDLSAGQSFFRGTSKLIDFASMSRLFGGKGLTGTATEKFGNDWMKEALTDDVSVGMKGADLVNELGAALLPMGAMYKGVDAGVKGLRAGSNALAQLGKGGNIAYRSKLTGENLAKQSLAETGGIGSIAALGYNTGENIMERADFDGQKRSNLERALTTTGEAVLGGGLDVAGRLVGRAISNLRKGQMPNPIETKAILESPDVPNEIKSEVMKAQKPEPFNVLAQKPQQKPVSLEFDMMGGRSQTQPKVDFRTQTQAKQPSIKEIENFGRQVDNVQKAKLDLELNTNAYTHSEQNYIKGQVENAAARDDIVPENIKFSKPKYGAGAWGQYNIDFESDMDKMLYSATARSSRNSKTGEMTSTAKMTERYNMLQTISKRTGKTTDELRIMGDSMREQMKLQAKVKRQSPDTEDDVLSIPRLLEDNGSTVDLDAVARQAQADFATSPTAKSLLDKRSALEQALLSKPMIAKKADPGLKKAEQNFVSKQKKVIAEEVKKVKAQSKQELDEIKQVLKQKEDDFVNAKIEETGYESQVAKYEEIIKKANESLGAMQDAVGKKIFIPKQNLADYPDFPKGMLTSDPTIGHDIAKAADNVGMGDNIEGFSTMLRGLVDDSKTLKKDVVTMTKKEVKDLERLAKEEFKKSDTYQSFTEPFKAIKSTYDEQLAEFAKLDDAKFSEFFKNTDEFKALSDLNKPKVETRAVKQANPLASLGVKPKPKPKLEKVVSPKAKLEKDATTSPFIKGATTRKDLKSPITKGESTLSKLRNSVSPKAIKEAYNKIKQKLSSDVNAAKVFDVSVTGKKWKDLSVEESLSKSLRKSRRSQGAADAFTEKIWNKKFIKQLEKSKVSISEFDEYALAIHARDIFTKNTTKASRAKELVKQLENPGQFKKAELEKTNKELEGLQAYILPERATSQWVDLTLNDFKGNEGLKKAHQMFNKINKQMRDLQLNSELKSQKQIEAMEKEHPNWVSMKRDFEEAGKIFGNGTNITRPKDHIKKRGEGSLLDVTSPFENALENTYKTFSNAYRNRAMQVIAKQEKTALGKNFFRKLAKGETQDHKDVVSFFENGERVHYEVKDKALVDMIGILDAERLPEWMKAVEASAMLLKKGATQYNLKFILTSGLQRDNLSAVMASRTGMNPFHLAGGFIDSFAGKTIEKITKGKFKSYVDMFEDQGGSMTGLISRDMSLGDKGIKGVAKELSKSKNRRYADSINLFRHISTLGEKVERIQKLGEIRSAKGKGLSDEDAMFEAVDLIDYSDQGEWSRTINKIFPYFSPAIRGNVRLAQSFKENPAKFTAKGLAYVTTPTLAIYGMRYAPYVTDDQRDILDNMQPWEKNMYWHIPLMDGENFLPVPKAHVIAQLFANPVERTLDYLRKEDPKAFEGMLKDIAVSMTPPHSAPIVKTGAEVMFNKSLFTDRPIVGWEDERTKENKEDEFNAYTSELAKMLGKGMNISPMKMDYFMKGMTGGLGKQVLDATDAVLDKTGIVDVPSKPQKTSKDSKTPFNGLEQFAKNMYLRDNTRSSSKTSNLYDATNKLSGEKNDERLEIRSQIRDNNEDVTTDQISKVLKDSYTYSKEKQLDIANDALEEIKTINFTIGNINRNKTMTSKEKGVKIRELRKKERLYHTYLEEKGVTGYISK